MTILALWMPFRIPFLLACGDIVSRWQMAANAFSRSDVEAAIKPLDATRSDTELIPLSETVFVGC